MGNAQASTSTPAAALHQVLTDLLQGGSFRFDIKTREFIRAAEYVLKVTKPVISHDRPVGLYWFDRQKQVYEPISESLGLDSQGKPRPGCTYLYR